MATSSLCSGSLLSISVMQLQVMCGAFRSEGEERIVDAFGQFAVGEGAGQDFEVGF